MSTATETASREATLSSPPAPHPSPLAWLPIAGPCPICKVDAPAAPNRCSAIPSHGLFRCLVESQGSFFSGFDPEAQARVWLHWRKDVAPYGVQATSENGQGDRETGRQGDKETGSRVRQNAGIATEQAPAPEAGDEPEEPNTETLQIRAAAWNALGAETMTLSEIQEAIRSKGHVRYELARLLTELEICPDLFEEVGGPNRWLFRRSSTVIRAAQSAASSPATQSGTAALDTLSKWAKGNGKVRGQKTEVGGQKPLASGNHAPRDESPATNGFPNMTDSDWATLAGVVHDYLADHGGSTEQEMSEAIRWEGLTIFSPSAIEECLKKYPEVFAPYDSIKGVAIGWVLQHSAARPGKPAPKEWQVGSPPREKPPSDRSTPPAMSVTRQALIMAFHLVIERVELDADRLHERCKNFSNAATNFRAFKNAMRTWNHATLVLHWLQRLQAEVKDEDAG